MKRKGTILIMGLLSLLFGCNPTNGRYISEPKFKEIMTKQTAWTPETLKQLNKLGVKDDTQLKLEYFFYTNTIEKASALAKVMEKRGYSVVYEPSAHDKKIYVITGWTGKMSMNEATVIEWTRQMCQIGYDNDCEFDGWDTTPEQD
jgi:hypothetical protein